MLPKKKLTPHDLVGIAARRGWLLVVPPAITCFAALLYSASVPNVYQSDMLIAIVPQRVPDTIVRSTVTLRTEERLDALTVQVTSRTVLEGLIAEFDLYSEERSRLPLEDVVQTMRANVDVELDRPRMGPRGPEPASSFHVRFTHTDPLVAARVTQRLGSLFVDENSRDRGALAAATDQFLQSQLDEARKRLEDQESRLEEFRKRHGKELPTQMQANMNAMQSMQMQIQALVESIARDRDRKLMLERLYREAAAEPSMSVTLPASAAEPVQSAQQQLAAAKSFLEKLELRFKADHPDVVRTKRLIAELEPKAAAEAKERAAGLAQATPPASPQELQRREQLRQMAAEIESLDRQFAFKQSEEARLRSLVAEYQRRIEAVPGLEAEWSAMTRDYDTLQSAYRELLNKSEASKLSVDLEKRQIGERFRILDPANVPVRPISPNRLQITAIGVALGLLLGAGIGALLELRDSTFRTEEDVLEVLRLPVMALVPYVSTARDRARRMRTRLVMLTISTAAVVAGGYAFWAMKLWNYIV